MGVDEVMMVEYLSVNVGVFIFEKVSDVVDEVENVMVCVVFMVCFVMFFVKSYIFFLCDENVK